PAGRADAGAGAAEIAARPESRAGLLALSAAQEAAGFGDAPWPPHYQKQDDEPPRVTPSRRKRDMGGPENGVSTKAGSRRRSRQPLITIAKAEHEADARAGLERWTARHPTAAARLDVDDVLVDSMRGRSSTWTRIRVNLRHVPQGERPAEEP